MRSDAPAPPIARGGVDGPVRAVLRAARAVVAAAGEFDQAATVGDGAASPGLVPRLSGVLMPIPAIQDAARPGLVNLSTDHAGVARYAPMIFDGGGTVLPSFALAAASAALGTEPVLGRATLKLAARSISTDLGYHLPIRYYGPRGSF